MNTIAKAIAWFAVVMMIPMTALGGGIHKVTLDAEENGSKCKVDAYAGGAGYCGLKGEVEINGDKVTVTGTGLVSCKSGQCSSIIGVLGGSGSTCVFYKDRAHLEAHSRFLAWVDPRGSSGVEAYCDDGTLYKSDGSDKLQLKYDSDSAN